MRRRSRDKAYGMEGEPFAFFVARNIIVAGALLFDTWKLSTFRGLPNVLITMSVLTVIYARSRPLAGPWYLARRGNMEVLAACNVKKGKVGQRPL